MKKKKKGPSFQLPVLVDRRRKPRPPNEPASQRAKARTRRKG